MANKEQEKLNATSSVDTDTTNTQSTVDESIATIDCERTTQNLGLFVEKIVARDKSKRPILTQQGDPIFNYRLPCEIEDQKYNIDFLTKDVGGYESMNLVYPKGVNKAELQITTDTYGTGSKKRVKTTMQVSRTTDYGVTYVCTLRFSRDSDSDLFNNFINYMKYIQSKGANI